MLKRHAVVAGLVASLSLVALSLPTVASAASRVRGAVVAVKDGAISVATADGATQEIKTASGTRLLLASAAQLSDVKPGEFVGVVSTETDGKQTAREVQIFAKTLRGANEGRFPWDTGPRSAMTNANVATVEQVGADRELKLSYKGGEQTITVPDKAPVVALDVCGPDQLVAGRKVFVILKSEAEPAVAVIIGAEGVTPPM